MADEGQTMADVAKQRDSLYLQWSNRLWSSRANAADLRINPREWLVKGWPGLILISMRTRALGQVENRQVAEGIEIFTEALNGKLHPDLILKAFWRESTAFVIYFLFH